MRRLVALALLLPLAAWAQTPHAHEPEQPRPWAVYFTPEDGATQAVVEALALASRYTENWYVHAAHSQRRTTTP